MLRVAEVAPEAKEVRSKTQNESLHFFAGVATNLSRKFFDGLKRQFFCGHLLDDLLDLLHLIFRDERPAQLLQVDRRAILGNDRPYFVTGKDLVQNLVLFQAIKELQQQPGAEGRFRFVSGTSIE